MNYDNIKKREYFSFGEIFSRYKNNIALEKEEICFHYESILKEVNALVLYMQKMGISSGDRVGYYEENNEKHFFLLLACWILRCVFVPLNFKNSLNSVIKDVPWLDYLITNEKVDASCRVVTLEDIVKDDEITIQDVPIYFEQHCLIIMTSGSTGLPKGVILSVGNLFYSALGTIEFLHIKEASSYLLSLPLYHIGGIIIWMRTLLAGAKSIMLKTITLGEMIHRYQPDYISLVPTQLIQLMQSERTVQQLQCTNAILLGGAKTPQWIVDKALDLNIPILPTYGSSETCAQITSLKLGAKRKDFYSSGKVLPYRIIKLDDDGIIWVGGKTLFKGYITKAGEIEIQKDTYFKTSDLGDIDDEGNLTVFGRSDLCFISGGENINPIEIEKAFLSISGVYDAVVVGISDQYFGEVAWAFIEMIDSKTVDELKFLLLQKLPSYKIPKNIIIFSEKMLSKGLKFSRTKLREYALYLRESRENNITLS